MSPEDFAKIDALFSEAVALPSAERLTFLRRATGDDSTLFEEVRALLEHHSAPHVVFDMDAADAASRVVAARESSAETTHPDTIGGYRIVRMIDRGGMGVVYLAEQEEPRRQVALKILQSHLITPGRLRRFSQEVQLLARLRHPGIAQVYEAGSHDLGEGSRPWFAMEFVDGPLITEFVNARKLTTAERLRLMISVCDAVQHAHQRGVIHRDLKPGNILVSEEDATDLDDSTYMLDVRLGARPKVLDFGIARATDHELGHSTMHTQTGQLLGTLPYMSPEQVAGEPLELDVRSDVYSLGVILYELLTGRLPYDVKDRPLPTVARAIAETPPAPLSSVDQTLKGDLEQIVRKALAKDKRERYQSAAALGEDLLHFLNDEPVTARPPTAWYQWRKFARRNRTLVTGAIALLVILLVSSVVSTSLYWRAERESRAKELQVLETQWQAYTANIAAAHSAIREGRAADARQFLDTAPAHLRGWEWRHLDGLLDRASITLHSSDAYVEDAIFTRDQAFVITGDDNGHLHRYDAVTGAMQVVHELAHDHWIHDLDLHPGLPRFAAASSDRTIGIYDSRTLETIGRIGPLPSAARVVVWSPDGAALYTAIDGGTILRLDPEDGRVQRQFAGHTDSVEQLLFTRDDATLVSASGDTTVRFWNVEDGTERARFETGSPVRSVCLSPDETRFACSLFDGYVSVYSIDDATRIAHWPADESRVLSLAFNPDGTLLATGGQSSRLRLWETKTWRMTTELLGHAEPVRSVSFSADGDCLLSAANDHTARIWNLDRIGVDVVHGHDAWVYGVRVSDDGTTVASASGHSPALDGTVRVFDLHDGAELHRLESARQRNNIIFHLSTNDDLTTIITHFGTTIRLWRPASDSLVDYESESFSPSSAMTKDGRYAAVAMWETPRVHAFDLETDQRIAVINLAEVFGADTELSEVAFSPAGDRLVVAAGEVDTIAVLSWPEGQVEQTHAVPYIPDDPVALSTAFSGDGRLFAMALEGRIALVEFATWSPVATLPINTLNVSLAFSPDGTRLFAGGNDGAVRIWDLPSLRLVGTLYIHPTEILDLDLSANGTTLVTGGTDTTIRALRAPPNSAQTGSD